MNDYFFGTLEPFSWFLQDVFLEKICVEKNHYRGDMDATWMPGGFFWRVLGQQKLLPGIHLRKFTWNSKTGWFVDVSPFPRCIFWFHVSFWGYRTEGQATHQRDPSKQPLDENDSRRRKESRSISWSFNVFFSQRKIFRAGCLRVWPHMDPFLSWRVPKMMAHCARTVWRLWCLRANYNMANPAIWQIFFVCPFQQATFLFGLQSRTLHFDLGRFRGGKILAGMSLIWSIFGTFCLSWWGFLLPWFLLGLPVFFAYPERYESLGKTVAPVNLETQGFPEPLSGRCLFSLEIFRKVRRRRMVWICGGGNMSRFFLLVF